ncbi:MAG TPA: hypothetical protein VM165_04030 [Planctomycetaceae bacterium]|nr:hypothetical protein [Planctomycetaceae bacterium]
MEDEDHGLRGSPRGIGIAARLGFQPEQIAQADADKAQSSRSQQGPPTDSGMVFAQAAFAMHIQLDGSEIGLLVQITSG